MLCGISPQSFGQFIYAEEKRAKPPIIQYTHELRAGYGMMAAGGFYRTSAQPDERYSASPNAYIYYSYRIKKGFKAAMTLGYNQTVHSWYESIPGLTSPPLFNEVKNHNLRISPAFQYEWYRRGIITFYSDIGFTWIIPSNHRDSYNNYKPMGYITPNITPFGMSVGSQHWFGAFEVASFGPRGFFNLSFGYRF